MLASIEITWGILGIAFAAGFLGCTAISIMVGIYFRSTLRPRIRELEQENEILRANIDAFNRAFEKMRITPPQAERVVGPVPDKT